MSFKDHYQALTDAQRRNERKPGQVHAEKNFTFDAVDMPLRLFAEHISRETSISIVVADSLLGHTVTLRLVDQPVSLVLDALARQLHVEVHRQTERLYFIGDARPEDRAVLVRRVRGLEQDEIERAVGTIVGSSTNLKAFPDGLLVVADKAAVLARVEELINGIEAAGRPAWAVQLFLVTLTEDDLAELGFDVTPSVEVGVSYAAAAAGGVSEIELASGLQAVLKAAHERSTMRLVAEPFFYLVDGDDARYERVRILAVPTSTISESGQFVTSGYQPFQAGTTVRVGIREVGVNGGQKT